MAEVTVGVGLFSVRGAAPNQKFGWTSSMPLRDDSWALGRANLSAIPVGAVVTAATLTVTSGATEASHTLRLRQAGAWNSDTTWTSRPSTVAGTEVTVTGTSPGTYEFPDIASWVQACVSSGRSLSFMVWADYASPTRYFIKGSTAATGTAWLDVTYTGAATRPTSLNPAGDAVGVGKPVVTFDADPDTIAVQVQIDAANDFGSPDFDSGTVAADAGLLDLSATAYAGLADGATTYWRARCQNPLGWSPWSAAVSFSRDNKPTLTITSPTSTPDDLTPELGWTFASQSAWRAWLNVDGKRVADSRLVAGAASAWDPGVELEDGVAGVFWLRCWDDVDRDATPGDPEFAQASKAFTVTLTEGLTAPDTCVAAPENPFTPTVQITGTRAAGIPDEWLLLRRKVGASTWERLGRFDGTDYWTGSGFELWDFNPPMNVPTEYAVRALGSGDTSPKRVAAAITPSCRGIWLISPGTGERAVLWGVDEAEQVEDEVAVLHQPLPRDDGRAVQAVRRRLARALMSGTVTGTLIDVPGCPVSAADSESALRGWREDNDAGHVYRMILGNRTIPVILGDITIAEQPANGPGERILGASAAFWERES